MKTIAIVAGLLLIAGITSPAFAATSVFQVDVKDFDISKSYQVCMSSEGYEPLAQECMNFKGSEFTNYYAEFFFEDLLIGDPFYIYVQDLSTNLFAYEHVNNTQENPQIINISVSNMGPKQEMARTYDVESNVTVSNVTVEDEPAVGERLNDDD